MPTGGVEQVSVIVEEEGPRTRTHGEQRELRKGAGRMLDTPIAEADRYIRAQHTSGDWWDRTTGRVKEGIRNSVMDIDTVKAGIPEYAEQILLELENPETREEIGDFLSGVVGDVADSTFAQTDLTLYEAIRQRYRCRDSTACAKVIESHLDPRRAVLLMAGVLLCAALMLWAVIVPPAGDPLPWLLLSFSTISCWRAACSHRCSKWRHG
jgi:hypothetical protein